MNQKDILKIQDLPPCIRICAGTDGSITQLLEVLTGKIVQVETIYQNVVRATPDMARLLEIEAGEEVNKRLVTLKVEDIVYVLAKSLAPISRIPEGIRQDLMKADIPIGRILREYKLETRRDILKMEIVHRDFFEKIPVLSREYNIIYCNKVLMWINECFPIDERWKIEKHTTGI